jgi:hypothetical protein
VRKEFKADNRGFFLLFQDRRTIKFVRNPSLAWSASYESYHFITGFAEKISREASAVVRDVPCMCVRD